MNFLKWLCNELNSAVLILAFAIIIHAVIYAYCHRYYVHSAYKQTVIVDLWSGSKRVVADDPDK